MTNNSRNRIKDIQKNISDYVLSDYVRKVQSEINATPKRRKSSTATQVRQRIISDYRNAIRRTQRTELPVIKQKLFERFNKLTGDTRTTYNVFNDKDRFGYTFNYSIQRANTRLINQLNSIYRKNTKRGKLDRTSFDAQASSAVETNHFLKSIIDYHTTRAINSKLFDIVKATGARRVLINLSSSHNKPCICNTLAKEYAIDKAQLPPFHLHCRCYVTFPQTKGLNSSSSINDTSSAIQAVFDDLQQIEYDNTKVEDYYKKKYPEIEFDLKNITPMIANIMTTQFDKLAKEYPEVVNKLKYFGSIQNNDKRVRAYEGEVSIGYYSNEKLRQKLNSTMIAGATTDGRNLFLNPKYLNNNEVFREQLKKSYANGHTADNTVDYILTHEFGHLVDYFIASRDKNILFPNEAVNGYRSLDKKYPADITLSRYAMTSDEEAFAEAFAASYHRPKNEWNERIKQQDSIIRNYFNSKIRIK